MNALRLNIVVHAADISEQVEVFTASRFRAGNAYRLPYGASDGRNRIAKSRQSDFIATAAETGVAGAQAGRILHVIRSWLTKLAVDRIRLAVGPGVDCTIPGEVVVATVFNHIHVGVPAMPSFGYTVIDTRHSQEAYVPAARIGGPVGIVRSPRAGSPAHAHWIVETHATRKAMNAAWRRQED
jgi:hypothetical protein